MGLFFLLWPLAALASFTAKTQEVPDASNLYNLGGNDGKIDQIVVTFDQNVIPSTAYDTDFEVVGYQVLNATASGKDVTLNVLGIVQDTGATPVVYFHPGRLQYSSTANVVSAGQTSPSNTTATDACAPVWDVSYGSTLLLAPVMDSDFIPHNDAAQPAGLYVAFSEKVNLASASQLKLVFTDGFCEIVACSHAVAWTPVGGAGGSSLSAVSHVKGTGLCEDSELADSRFGLNYSTADIWRTGVREVAPMALPLTIRGIQNSAIAPFSSNGALNSMGTGFALSDATTSFMVSNTTICRRGNSFTLANCPTTPLIQPNVIVSSLDLDGNGRVDTIQVLTKQHRVDLVYGGGLYSAGAANLTITYKKEARPLLDTLVISNRSLWSLPGYNITSMVEERGRVLLTVTEPSTVDTTPITSTLTYTGALTSWTGNVLGASGIPVTDRICPIITGVKGMGGTNAVYIFFSENVSSTINYTMFLATYGSSFGGMPFTSGVLNESSVFIGYLAANLTSANFNANQQLLSISGLPSITQVGGGCSLRRKYVPLTKLDTTPPNITAVYTRDFNSNGRIDGVSVKFSERVADSTVNPLQFSLDGYSNLTFVVSTLNDDVVEFTVNELPGINTTATPIFTAMAGVLTDLSDNALGPRILVSTDGVGPYPLTARTATDLANLDMNKIIITFSEPVFNGSASEFSIISPAGITIVNYSATGAVATLYLSTPTPVPSDSNVTLGFVRNSLQDTLGNLAPNFTVIAVDGVPPACGAVGNSAITEDTDANGHIDRITLSCGEPVAGGNASSYLVAGYTVIGINASPSVCPSTYINCLYIYVQEKNYYDTGVKPAVTYTASPAVTDLLGNPMGNLSFTLVDRTPPVLTRILTQDTNGDGKIDSFRLEFSEPMSNPVGLGPMWNIAGYTVPAFVSSSGQTYLELIANASVGGYDGGATPNVTVASNGAKDSNSNSLGAYTNFRTTDGVFPLVFNVSTAGSCKLSLLQISMSENINLSSVNTSSFNIPGYNVTGAILGGVLPFGFSLQVAPYPLLTPDVIAPNVSYSSPLSIVDNGGNALVNFTKTAIDALAPCMIQCSGHVGGSYVAITFSEPVSTGVSNTTLTLTNFQLNSSVSASSLLVNSTRAYQITLSAPFVESDINFNSGDTFASIKPVSIHDTNNIPATNSCYVFNDDITPPQLLSAVTVNSDTDAMIDRIVLTFDDQVKDSTFNATHWNVSDYVIANFSTGTTANDNIMYLNLVTKSVPDTGATPTVTYTKPPFGGASDRNRNLFNTTSMVAVDGAVPMLVSFAGIILSAAQGGNIAIATFSEPVTAANGSMLTSSNFIYNSANGNASSIQVFLDADASTDQIATMRLNTLALSDFTGDSVVATVWDRANLSSTNRSVALIRGDTRPPVLVQAKTGDVNQDGKIDHLTVVFNESMLNTSFNIAAFSLTSYLLASLVVNDNTVDLAVNGSGQLDGNATPAFAYATGIVADLNGNFLQNFSVNASDGVSPFLVDCSSTLPNINDVECRFSESVTAINSDFVLGGPLSGANITSPTVASSGEVITIRLNRTLVLMDFKNNGTIDLINGTVVDGANNFGIPRAVYLRNTDTFPPNLTAAFTRDTDCNGFIDAIELVFSEGVISTSVNAADFTVGGGFAFTGVVSTTANANVVRLVVTESTTPNTDAGNFPLSYNPGNLTDLSENRALAFNETVRDGAGVALVSVVGTVDQSVVNVTFSGAIADANISGFRLLNFSSQIAAMIDSNGADSSVTFQMTSVLSPRDFILPARIDPLVVDPDGNAACRIVALTNPDKTLPTVGSIKTLDENGDGYLDGILFNCSKPIYEASLNATDFSVVNYTVTNVTALQPLNLFKLSIAQKNGTVDASVTPQVSYTKGSLTDRYGNALASFSNMQSMDGAGPAIVSAIGFGSSLTLTFSKPIYNSSNISTFKLTDVIYNASGNASTANALSQITDKNGADTTLSFSMSHEFTAAEYAADTIAAVSASIRDVHGNQASSAQVKIRARGVILEPEEVSGLTETQIILIAAVGGGGLLLLLIAVIAVVFLKKKGGCCKKKKDVAFDQNQIANEFDFGSAGSTEMTQSSKGAQRLEA